jgi:hypothetical protein
LGAGDSRRKGASHLKTFIFAYLGGLLASIPAYRSFDDVGASPFRNLDALDGTMFASLTSTITYLALLWVLPALGSAIGAKIGGSGADFRYMYGRGVGGQVLFSIGLGVLMMTVAVVGNTMGGLSTHMQTIAFLMFAQIGCSLGTVWFF